MNMDSVASEFKNLVKIDSWSQQNEPEHPGPPPNAVERGIYNEVWNNIGWDDIKPKIDLIKNILKMELRNKDSLLNLKEPSNESK